MNYKIVFLDLDGTILNHNGEYKDSTKIAIEQAQQKGVEIFFATGRAIHEIRDLALELGIHSMIGYNGAYGIYKDKPIVNEPFHHTTIQGINEIANKYGHEIIFTTNGKNYYNHITGEMTNYFINKLNLSNNFVYTDAVMNDILGITITNVPPEHVAFYEENPEIHLTVVNIPGVKNTYDVVRKTVNKGSAVKKVLSNLGITKQQAIAFGDGMNDKEMFQVVGESFVMENGNPEVFKHAKHITPSWKDSGIYMGFKKLGLVE